MSKSEEIKARLVQAKQRYWAGDNISAYECARDECGEDPEHIKPLKEII